MKHRILGSAFLLFSLRVRFAKNKYVHIILAAGLANNYCSIMMIIARKTNYFKCFIQICTKFVLKIL